MVLLNNSQEVVCATSSDGKVREVKASNVKLVSSQVVHEGLNQEVSGEVEDQAEGDGDGQRRQSLLKDGQQQQSEAQALTRRQTGVLQVNGRCVPTSQATTYDQNGDEAGECRVPVSACRRSFSNQNTVEDEVAQAELHASCTP